MTNIQINSLKLIYKAYDEQTNSSNSIHSRVSFLSATISLLITAILTILKILIDNKVEIYLSITITAIIITILFSSLLICLYITTLGISKGFPIVSLKENLKKIKTEDVFFESEFDLCKEIVLDIRNRNVKKMKLFNFAIKLLYFSVAFMFIGAFIILITYV